jgi:hypothetical protein
MKKDELCLQNPDQLSGLKLSFFPFGREEISYIIDDPSLPEDTRSQWEHKINERMEDCGCHLAGVGFVISVVAYIIWIFLGPVQLPELSLAHLWYGLLTAAAGLFVGKIVGFSIARSKMIKTVQEIKNEWISYSDFPNSEFVKA